MAHVKDTYTFLHDANARNDERLLLLRAEYGLEAYGWYWSVIEMLREANAYQLQISCVAGFAHALGITGERFSELLAKSTAVGLFAQNDSHFWSPSLRRRMEHYDNKRARLRANALQKQTKSPPNEVRLGSEQEQVPDKCPPLPPSLSNATGREAIQKWASYKRSRGEGYKTSQGWTEIIKEFEPMGAEALMAGVNNSIKNNWAGLFPVKGRVVPAAPEPKMNNHPSRRVVSKKDPL